ncbi:MAG: hypothetical protein ACYDHW_05000 [Syntrophorhabdaceae bacterium]
MKTLSNNKGIALIILLAAIVFIAALGAGFVSLMGTKHIGFLHQHNSYRALNIANAGAEYAIRSISDGLSDSNSTYYTNLIAGNGNIGSINFEGGTFSGIRNFSYVNSQDYIEITGTYSSPTTSTTKVKITSFSRYLQNITFISDPTQARKPSLIGSTIYIPIMSNDDLNDIPIDTLKIEIRDSATNALMPYLLQYIYNETPTPTPLFIYGNKKKVSEGCPSVHPPPCRGEEGVDGVDLSVYNVFPITGFQITKTNRIRTISIKFKEGGTGKYTITFLQGGESGLVKGIIKFKI